MKMKQAVSLFLGASLCLPLSACKEESVPMETVPSAIITENSAPPETTVEATAAMEETVSSVQEPADEDFVAVKDYIPDIWVELKYAAADNFTGQVIYDFEDAYLRYGTVKKLMAVQEELRAMGLSLKIWDSYRPRSAQYKLWEVYPDDTYVANPETGNSNHSRGNAVDVTLVDSNGNELEMPSEFDDFSGKADRGYTDCSDMAIQNSGILQRAMEKHGFKGYSAEWWHYADTEQYEVEELFDPAVVSKWYAGCAEFLSLRTEPDTSAGGILRIPAEGKLTLMGLTEGSGGISFAYVDYQGQRGYVMKQYLHPIGELWYAECEEYISLRKEPSVTAEVIKQIPKDEPMLVIAYRGEFAWVYYQGLNGYVLRDYIRNMGQTMYADCEEYISLRKEPSTAAEVITKIHRLEEISLLEYCGEFARVYFEGKEGYVLASYIKPLS